MIDWLINWLIDCIGFYAVSAIFQPYYGGDNYKFYKNDHKHVYTTAYI